MNKQSKIGHCITIETLKMSLQYVHVGGKELQTDKQRQTDDPITRGPRNSFQAGHKNPYTGKLVASSHFKFKVSLRDVLLLCIQSRKKIRQTKC